MATGPLSSGAVGRFLVPDPLPKRLLYVEPLRRRMRLRFGGACIAESEQVILLFEPGRYPVAYFPQTDIAPDALERMEHTTSTRIWADRRVRRPQVTGHTTRSMAVHRAAATQANCRHTSHSHGGPWMRSTRKTNGSSAMPPILIPPHRHSTDLAPPRGPPSRPRHRGHQTPTRALRVRLPPRWYVPRADIDEAALTLAKNQTFCPYKGVCTYYDIDDLRHAAWSIPRPILKSAALPTSYRSSRKFSRSISTARSCVSKRASRSLRTAPIAS